MQLSKEQYARKRTHMVVRCKWKILSLRITVWHHSVSLVMPNSHPPWQNFQTATPPKKCYKIPEGRIICFAALQDYSSFHMTKKWQKLSFLYIIVCSCQNLTRHRTTILYPCPINIFKIPVQVYFLLGTNQIETTILVSLHRIDISYKGENW